MPTFKQFREAPAWVHQEADGAWWEIPAARMVDGVAEGLGSELAMELGLCSEWVPPDGPDGTVWMPSDDDCATALTTPILAAVVKFVCEYLDIAIPPVVARSFEMGAEDVLWITEGREPGAGKTT